MKTNKLTQNDPRKSSPPHLKRKTVRSGFSSIALVVRLQDGTKDLYRGIRTNRQPTRGNQSTACATILPLKADETPDKTSNIYLTAHERP